MIQGEIDPARAAMEEIHRRLRTGLECYAFRLCGNHEDAYDAVQKTFQQFWEQRVRHDTSVPLRPWVFGICRNCCHEVMRSRKWVQKGSSPEGLDVSDPSDDLIDLVMRDEWNQAFWACLGDLNQEDRELLLASAATSLRKLAAAQEKGHTALTARFGRLRKRLNSCMDRKGFPILRSRQ